MVRSAAAFVAVVILAGFTWIQQVATHKVVAGDTLWDLAQNYYGNPFEWRRIWEANKSQVADPNLILPGWVLTIPDAQAKVQEVQVETPAASPAQTPAPMPASPSPSLAKSPTIFRSVRQAHGEVGSVMDVAYASVSRDRVYSAPWLVRGDGAIAHDGVVEGFAGGASISETPRTFDKVRLSFSGMAPSVGTELQLFRVTKILDKVGQVVQPTGVVRVTTDEGGSPVAEVTQEYTRIQLGDFVGPLPSYTVSPGEYAQPVSGGSQAMIMGFAGRAVLQDVGEVAFLDQGSEDGVAVGDEYELVNPALGPDHPAEGRLQVVGVTRDGAAARIMQMDDAVFRQGVVVRLTRKMR